MTLVISSSGCSSFLAAKKEVKTLSGPKYKVLHLNKTLLHTCITSFLRKNNVKKILIAVEAVTDETGKYAANGYGAQVTRGFSNMLISSFYQANSFIQLERLNHDIILWDFKLINSNLFEKTQAKTNPQPIEMPQYLVTGSITELNFSIHSNASEISLYGISAGIRTFWVSVGIDIRVIDAKTSEIVYSIPIKKQLWGYETKGGIYKLIDSNILSANLSRIKKESIGQALREISDFVADKVAEKLYNIHCNASDPGSVI